MESLTPAAVPVLALAISVVTFFVTSRRADQIDRRVATRDRTLAERNSVLAMEVSELRARIAQLEQLREEWQRERIALLALLPLIPPPPA